MNGARGEGLRRAGQAAMREPHTARSGRASGGAVGYTVHLVCPDCGKEFTGNSSTSGVRSNYRRHLLTHTGERPFPCTYCHQRFTTKPNLRRHVRSLHPSQSTPCTQVRHPSDAEAPVGAMTASPQLLPEMHLPPAVTASVADVTSCGSATAASNVNSVPSCSKPPVRQRADPEVFTCEDCELETSSRAKLHRHKRYYCPFRDNIFTDPVTDALDLYRTLQQQQQQKVELRQHDNSCDSDETSSTNEGVCIDGQNGSFVGERVGRRRRKMRMSLELTETERNYLTQVAEQSGLKFVQDAYASDGSDDGPNSSMLSEDSSLCTSSEVSFTAMRPLSAPHVDGPGRKGAALLSPKRTPLHGFLLSPCTSPDRRVQRSPHAGVTAAVPSSVALSTTLPSLPLTAQSSCSWNLESDTPRGITNNTAEDASEDDDDFLLGALASEGLTHLHHHRRGSGRRRERHILQKRLRAQEEALMALATDSPYRRFRHPRRDHAGVTERRGGPVGEETVSPLLETTAVVSGAHTRVSIPTETYAYLGPSTSLLTPHVMAQAESLLAANRRHPQRGKQNAGNAFVCPYCADFATFTSHRGLRAHAMRAHADKVPTLHASLAETEAAHAKEGGPHEGEVNGVLSRVTTGDPVTGGDGG